MHFAANQALFFGKTSISGALTGKPLHKYQNFPPAPRRKPSHTPLPPPWPPALGIAPAGRDSKNVLFQNDNVRQKRPFFSSVKPPIKFCPAFCPASPPLAFPRHFFFFSAPTPPPPPFNSSGQPTHPGPEPGGARRGPARTRPFAPGGGWLQGPENPVLSLTAILPGIHLNPSDFRS